MTFVDQQDKATKDVEEWRAKYCNTGITPDSKLLVEAYDENLKAEVTIEFLYNYDAYLKQTREMLAEKEQNKSKGFYRAGCVKTGEFVIIYPNNNKTL